MTHSGRGIVWRAGEQPLEAWLEWVRECLIGDSRFTVIGEVRQEDQPYGRTLHSGIDAAALAEVFAEAGIEALYVSTTRGLELSSPTVDIIPVPDDPQLGPPLLWARATPSGRVRLAAPVLSPADLDRWLRQLSPLLPEPVPVREGSAEPFARPLATGLLCRPDRLMVCVDTLDTRVRPGNPSSVVELTTTADRLGQDAALLRHPCVLKEQPVPAVSELAAVLAGLESIWSAVPSQADSPFTRLGWWAGAKPLAPGSRIEVVRIEHGSARLRISRKGRFGIDATGPVGELAHWARPLLDPAVHDDAYAGLRRGLATWLEQLQKAVFGAAPVRWRVFGPPPGRLQPGPLDASALAQWLHTHFPRERVYVDSLSGDTIELGGLRADSTRVQIRASRRAV
ncbi:hypothetical protein [Streptomyces sp. NBC_01465]|uniref:hypothetical protein n=1 Tax=Streptomyces sp. NBC_01465 TaxID=2903878 RepID=UPI002E2F0347|nr:hypothetical protein [Streptomyces sp. NBC_01465]